MLAARPTGAYAAVKINKALGQESFRKIRDARKQLDSIDVPLRTRKFEEVQVSNKSEACIYVLYFYSQTLVRCLTSYQTMVPIFPTKQATRFDLFLILRFGRTLQLGGCSCAHADAQVIQMLVIGCSTGGRAYKSTDVAAHVQRRQRCNVAAVSRCLTAYSHPYICKAVPLFFSEL